MTDCSGNRFRIILALMAVAVALLMPLACATAEAASGIEAEQLDGRTFSFTAPEFGIWDFGDGSVSTDRSPVHTFPGGGVFTVTHRSESGVRTAVLEVYDDAVVTTASTGSMYRCCIPGMTGVSADGLGGQDASWIRWDAATQSVVGVPTEAGEYMIRAVMGGPTLAYVLTVAEGEPGVAGITFSVEVERQTITATPSRSVEGMLMEWSVFDETGFRVTVSNAPTLVYEAEPGLYFVIMHASSFDEHHEASASVLVDESTPAPEPDESPDYGSVLLILAIAAVAVLVLWRFV